MLSDPGELRVECGARDRCLNAPYGARCFLTTADQHWVGRTYDCLNAPYGARCFLTNYKAKMTETLGKESLNAPYGARCFLTLWTVLYGMSKFVMES